MREDKISNELKNTKPVESQEPKEPQESQNQEILPKTLRGDLPKAAVLDNNPSEIQQQPGL
jgi:hypothetical protein